MVEWRDAERANVSSSYSLINSKGLILLPTVAALIASLVFVTQVKPHYTATAKLMLQTSNPYLSGTETAESPLNEVDIASAAEVAKSLDTLRLAIQKLTPNDLEAITHETTLPFLDPPPKADNDDNRRLQNFSTHIQVYPQEKTQVLLFEFTAQDPERAARGANALAEAFLDWTQATKASETQSAAQWLSQQVDLQREKVAEAEHHVETLRAQSGLAPLPSGATLPSQQLSEIVTQMASARSAEMAAKAKAKALKDLAQAGQFEDITTALEDETLRHYAETRADLKAQIAELNRTLLPGHPRMKELQGQLAEQDHNMRITALKRAHAFEQEAQIAATQVQTLQQALNDQQQNVNASGDNQAKLRQLELEAKSARDQLEVYLTKYREMVAKMAKNATPARGRIVAHALPPLSPTFPKPLPTIFLSTATAFFVSFALALARISLNTPESPQTLPPTTGDLPKRRRKIPLDETEPKPSVFKKSSSKSKASDIEALVKTLSACAQGERLSLLIVGEYDPHAQHIAHEITRQFSHYGRSTLINVTKNSPKIAENAMQNDDFVILYSQNYTPHTLHMAKDVTAIVLVVAEEHAEDALQQTRLKVPDEDIPLHIVTPKPAPIDIDVLAA